MASKYEEILKTKGFLPYFMDTMPQKFKQKAKDELGETVERQSSAIEELRKCILADKKLKFPTDDDFLMLFIRARKYNVNNALELVKNCYNLITSHPQLYNKLDKEDMENFARSRFIKALPFRDNEGCLVVIVDMENWDPDDFSVEILFGTVTAMIICMVMYPPNQITGLRLIFDAKGYTFKQMRHFIPKYISLVAKALRNSLPFRFKGIHVVNEAIVYHYAWSIMKIFLSKKIVSRIYLHGGNMKDMHKFIPKEILPSQYDGDYGNYNDIDWLTKEIDKYYERFTMMITTCFS